MKKNGKTLTNIVKKALNKFYMGLERPFRPSWRKRKKVQPEFAAVLRTNNIVKKFYKRPELIIDDLENLTSIKFETTDGFKLEGYTYEPNKGSNKWLVGCHWFAGHKNCALHHAKVFAEMGWNIMVFDFRGHGDSQKTPTTAIDEYLDLLAALDWLKANKTIDELALMGTSMGAFVVNYVAVKYAQMLADLNLKLIVSDCTYTSIYTLFMHVKRVYLKLVSNRRAKAFVQKQIRAHQKSSPTTDYENADVLKLIKEGHKPLAPGVFFHSLNDLVTPPSDTYELLIARKDHIEGDKHKIFTFAMHTQAIRTHFKSFNYEIASFINQYSPDEVRFTSVVERWELLKLTSSKNDKKEYQLE